MSRVNFDDTETRFTGPACGGGKSGDDVLDAVDRERLRYRIVSGESQRARGNDIVPAPITLRYLSVTCPRSVSTGLAAGMRQLHSSHATLLMNKAHDSSQRSNVIVLPDAQVLRADPPLGKNGRGFGQHQSSTAHRPAA